MATTKTLTPTNQAITLAAFTEKPDNRTNVTNDDKLADAVNTLNSNMPSNYFLLGNGGTRIPENTNLNNYTTAGCYYIEFASDAASIQNIPFVTAGMIFVRNTIPVSGRNYKQQIFLPFSTDDVYKRHTMDNGATWSEWKDDVKDTSTALGSHQGTGTFNLSQSVKNFRYVYIQIGYYQSGYPQYGQALVPVSRLAFSSEATYGIRIMTVDSTAGSCTIIFPSETSCQVVAMANNNWYTALYGIK